MYISTWHNKLPISLILILILVITTCRFTRIGQTLQKSHKNLYKLSDDQILNITFSQPIKINLLHNKTLQKPHTILSTINKGITKDEHEQKNIKDAKWNISITIKTIQGQNICYFTPINGFKTEIIQQQSNLQKQTDILTINQNKQNYIRQYLQLKEGINILNSQRLAKYLQKQQNNKQILNNLFSIICIPKTTQSKIIIKQGYPQQLITPIKINQPSTIIINKGQLQHKIYKLIINENDNNFAIKFNRKKGFPVIKIYECNNNQQCYHQQNIIPSTQLSKNSNLHKNRTNIKYMIQNMLTKTQQYIGTTKQCNNKEDDNRKDCELYLLIELKQQNEIQLQVILQSSNYVTKLIQNQILKQDLIADTVKKYEISLYKQQAVKINIQVYQGQVTATLKDNNNNNGWEYSPTQKTGIISIQIPISLIKLTTTAIATTIQKLSPSSPSSSSPSSSSSSQQKQHKFVLQIKSHNKDTTYSIVYSSGEYEIYIKDGHPTSHRLNKQQNISFYYRNQYIRNNPMYLSFNVNNTKGLAFIHMKIYYYIQEQQQQDKGDDRSIVDSDSIVSVNRNQQVSKQPINNNNNNNNKNNGKMKRVQYLPNNKLIQNYIQASSIVIQIPGNHHKLQISLSNTFNQSLQIAMTINDQQIIFLPLYHSLPLQIDKDSKVNLLIDNNQQGYIELTIKKCDQSYPQIAYSLNSDDFIHKIYDYQSLGESQRITKNTIKVKKGGGLYISISGDSITSSFIQISAIYKQIDHKKQKQKQNSQIKRGDHGDINYQLLTNSKVQIWFKEVECVKQCKFNQNMDYIYYVSSDRSQLYREMICPGIFMYKNNGDNKQIYHNNNNKYNNNTIPNTNVRVDKNGKNTINKNILKTQTHKITAKPSSDGIIAFKQILTNNIIYLNIKAMHKQTKAQFIYKDVQIVTFSGQISRMSAQFLFITFGTIAMVGIILFFVVRRQARMGYTAVSTNENQRKAKKTKLQVVKTN